MAGRATPATRVAQQARIDHRLHEYTHDPSADSYALEAAEALELDKARVFKTLVVDLDGRLTVCIIPAGD
ncbi:MAG TPA: Cys-tRNA(Pro) deacylase, partial [Conexibacter sp.]|nr:Cys-tRNA(Pro) deacylase [Conexibacter sp.]